MSALASTQRPVSRRYLTTVPPEEILPIVDRRFESSVKGIFVIGDVAGLPLVKIAANQGVEVMAKMAAAGLFDVSARDSDQLDLVIIGAGPAGLAAAMEAERQGLRYVVLERDKAASTVRSFPPGKKVYAEPQSLSSVNNLGVDTDLDKDEFLKRIDRIVRDEGLHIKEDTEVSRVRRLGDRQFRVETAAGKTFPTRLVLVAIGRQGQPRLLDCPGADDCDRVTYRLHSPDDYVDKDILIVGGGNSAIESALLLMDHNRVTLSYRGGELFRAKSENRRTIERAARDGRVRLVLNSQVERIEPGNVEMVVDGQRQSVVNDHVIAQIGTLPPVDFLLDMGLELDGIWTRKRMVAALLGLVVGTFIYFGAKHFVLRSEAAGEGKLLLPGLQWMASTQLPAFLAMVTGMLLPVAWLAAFALMLVNSNLTARQRPALLQIAHLKRWLVGGAIVYLLSQAASSVVTIHPLEAGIGPYYLPGFAWIYWLVPTYFTNLYGLYYLAYFVAILVFGLYWAYRSGHRLIWKRNLTIIATQWTLWWGIPTLLALVLGRNPWTPLITRSLNAWPLNLSAFQLAPVVGTGDPAWWHTVAVFGVVWAALLTFVVIPLVTLRWGKIYCSYICSCGALAETVGNGFRHRSPKGETPRRWERMGFVFVVLASLATIADLYGFKGPAEFYNVWIGTALSGAIAIGLYPFLGQRVWCRMWCPLAFWMNFWGRWSRFQITPEAGKCIDCSICNQYCQMGIDIKSRALQGKPVTLVDSPCVGCAECVVRCPMEILHLGTIP